MGCYLVNSVVLEEESILLNLITKTIIVGRSFEQFKDTTTSKK